MGNLCNGCLCAKYRYLLVSEGDVLGNRSPSPLNIFHGCRRQVGGQFILEGEADYPKRPRRRYDAGDPLLEGKHIVHSKMSPYALGTCIELEHLSTV
jgi:hypothetical protein